VAEVVELEVVELEVVELEVVELEGIEPSSAKRSLNALRPFPFCGLNGYRADGSVEPEGSPPSLSSMSAVFHAVSGLSLPSTTASVAGLRWSGPVRHFWSR
jgi:hypothetical protein